MLELKKLLERKQEETDSPSVQYELESLQARESDEKSGSFQVSESSQGEMHKSKPFSSSYNLARSQVSRPIPIKTSGKKIFQSLEVELPPDGYSDDSDEFYVGSPQGEERERYLKNFLKK